MSGDCGHGWLYHHDGPSGPCYACERDETGKLRAELAALRAERDALRADAERFAWYFGSEDKMPFMKAYIDGLASGYTLDQWRAAIDAAMERADET